MKALKLRVTVEVTPDGSYSPLAHSSSFLTFGPGMSMALLLSDVGRDVNQMVNNVILASPVAAAMDEIKEATRATETATDPAIGPSGD